jgi:cytochrome c55X
VGPPGRGGPVFFGLRRAMMRHHGRAALAAVAVLALGLSAAADPAAEKGRDDRLDPEQVQKGKQSYAAHCSHCHGFNMVSSGTVTYDLREFPRDQRERFFESVTNGKSNRMPPWGDVLTQDEIDDIWTYIRTGGKS